MLDRERIGIVGAGRLGTAIAAALRAAGRSVVGPLGRGATADDCDIVLLCVPDAEIARAAAVVAPGRIVGHASGATTLAPLAPHEAFSLHPLISVSHRGAHFTGAGCAISGSTANARAIATALAESLGMIPFSIAEGDRPLYHAAASMASNYFVTLEGAAERLFATCGVTRDQFVPLVRSALDHWAELGARNALTGPVVRGDTGTIARQRAAIEHRAPDLLTLWDVLTTATQSLASEPAEAAR
jgi:predicted short-subunit dehydrogenase-like oxidoreductase (DUF2520 family)